MIAQAITSSCGAVVVVIAIVGIAIVAIMARAQRGQSMLESWASENDLTIVSAERRYMMKGPFFFRSNEDNNVYRITVRDEQGRERSGYVRCGGYWLGIWLSSTVTVEWD